MYGRSRLGTRRLKRQRVPSRLIVFHDENHWALKGENSRFFCEEVHAWLARHLGEPGRH